MKKTIFVIIILTVFAFTSLSAQGLAVGVSGIQYYDEQSELKDAWASFLDGENVYWGGSVDILGRQWGIGLALNFDNSDYHLEETWIYDININLQYHFFGSRAFLDPFFQMGLGSRAEDYVDNDDDDPLRESEYFDVGLGLGLNLGSLGVFFRGMYNYEIESNDPNIMPFNIFPFKWVFGAKLYL